MAKKVKRKQYKLQISNSKLDTFRKCHYKYHLRYIEFLETLYIPKALWWGIVIHELLEYYYDDAKHSMKKQYLKWKDKFFAMSPTQQAKVGVNAILDIKTIMQYYVKYWKNADHELRDDNIEFIETEIFLKVEIFPGVLLTGKVDGIVKIKGKYYILEHKSFGWNKPDSFQRYINQQTIIYCYVMEKFYGYKIEGVLWDYIRSEPPREPGETQNGLSLAQNSKIIPLSYKRAVKRNGLRWKDYRKYMHKYEDNNENFFDRMLVAVNRRAMKTVLRDLKEDCNLMIEKGEVLISHSTGKDCKWCEYKGICELDIMGRDTSYVKTRGFKVNTYKLKKYQGNRK